MGGVGWGGWGGSWYTLFVWDPDRVRERRRSRLVVLTVGVPYLVDHSTMPEQRYLKIVVDDGTNIDTRNYSVCRQTRKHNE